MNFGRGWLFLLPLLAFVATAMLLSCGGSGGCGTTYDQFGNPQPNSGTCVNGPGITPGPPGGSIVSISICPGPPPPPTPLPNPSATATPTVAPTPCTSFFSEASVPQGCFIQFHAVATRNNNDYIDITNDSTSNWTSKDTTELSPTTIQGIQGIYAALSMGPPVDAVVSVPGISSSPIPVTIGTAEPTGVACPTIVLQPSTPARTPTM
jgi:hypothetical protein